MQHICRPTQIATLLMGSAALDIIMHYAAECACGLCVRCSWPRQACLLGCKMMRMHATGIWCDSAALPVYIAVTSCVNLHANTHNYILGQPNGKSVVKRGHGCHERIHLYICGVACSASASWELSAQPSSSAKRYNFALRSILHSLLRATRPAHPHELRLVCLRLHRHCRTIRNVV